MPQVPHFSRTEVREYHAMQVTHTIAMNMRGVVHITIIPISDIFLEVATVRENNYLWKKRRCESLLYYLLQPGMVYSFTINEVVIDRANCSMLIAERTTTIVLCTLSQPTYDDTRTRLSDDPPSGISSGVSCSRTNCLSV